MFCLWTRECDMLGIYKPRLNCNIEIIFILFSQNAAKQYFALFLTDTVVTLVGCFTAELLEENNLEKK